MAYPVEKVLEGTTPFRGVTRVPNICLINNSSQLKQDKRLDSKVKNNRIHEYEVQDTLRSIRTLDWTALQGQSSSQRQVQKPRWLVDWAANS